jgi:hypothetical protein
MYSRAKMPPSTPAMKMVPLNRRTLKNLHHVTPNSRFVLYGLKHYLRLYFEQRPRNHWLAALPQRSVEHQQPRSRQDSESAFPQPYPEPLVSCCTEYTGQAFAHHTLITRS